VSAETRVTVLIPDSTRTDDAEAICRVLRTVAPYCRIRAHAIDPAIEFADDFAHRARIVGAVMQSDVVLYLTKNTDRSNAGLIALRERAGFTLRLTEPEFGRAWFTANRKRSLFVLGELPGAFTSLAHALDVGCADPAAARRVREDLQHPMLAAV
jgi:hypothetical protein